ncbi:MAG: hypothetical protein RRC34_05395 [Lentisphaeria bacterium]|nr:hypothetical protein [Lentisphaeria bacterium]
MGHKNMTFPFEVSAGELSTHPDLYVDSVFACLESEFLVLPRGSGFVDYGVFEAGYEALKRVSEGFSILDPDKLLPVVQRTPVALVVLRAMLGFTPPELAYVTTQRTGVTVSQSAVRTLDRKARMEPNGRLADKGLTGERLAALVKAACELLNEGAPETDEDKIHRLDKADTRGGLDALRGMSERGMPYAMVLYERFLGRPFAGHRDSVSDLVGDSLESAIEEVLHKAGVSFRKTKRAERIDGFDQAPDFIIPSEFNPQIVIEAKLTEDDGTARDKVARIQRLDTLRRDGQPDRIPKYELVACIGGRGFGVRREDMKRLLFATDGKVFTLKTLGRLITCTRIAQFASRSPSGSDT